jgi:alpha-amylase
LQYDNLPRKSLIDHFQDNDVTLAAVASGEAVERGDFASGAYDARLRRNPNRIQVQLSRQGNAWGQSLKITKGLTLEAGSSTIEIAYMIEGLQPDQSFHFSVEFNFAGLPSNCDDRFFHDGDGRRLGHLGEHLDLHDTRSLGLVDEYLGIDVGWKASRASNIWTYPVETVSQSEGGFELVHQSVVVQPHWTVTPDASGRWSVTMELAIDTAMAERRREHHPVAVASS